MNLRLPVWYEGGHSRRPLPREAGKSQTSAIERTVASEFSTGKPRGENGFCQSGLEAAIETSTEAGCCEEDNFLTTTSKCSFEVNLRQALKLLLK